MPHDLRARFGVLRRARRPSDELPLSARTFAHDPDTPDTSGANGDLARDSGAGPEGTRIFVVPGNGAVCVVADGSISGQGDVAAGGCAEVDDAAAGRFVHGTYGGPFSGPHEVLAYGLVPDGVSTVELRNGAGEKLRTAVVGNVYAARIEDASPVTVHFGGTAVEVP